MRGELLGLVKELRARLSEPGDDLWTVKGLERAAGKSAGRPPAPAASAPDALAALKAETEACRRCPLGSQRIKVAFGVGSPEAEVMLVGEGPGYNEDRQGEPFVGKAGQLLDKILGSIGLSRQAVYIANIVKCHPMVDPSKPDLRGNDRPPSPSEIAACRGFLERQIALVKPRFIVTLGAVAAKVLLDTEVGITRLRGRWRDYGPDGIRLLPTYHPAALLRNPDLKREVWTDMKELKRALEETRQ